LTENKKITMHKILITRVLEGTGMATNSQRRAAFDNARLDEPLKTLINKVANHAYKVTDADIRAAKEAGLSEDQIFELVVCAAIGESTRQYETALATLDAVTEAK
jgi:alkylhydroperoxidase/carboxymuconolactone decarboxylase family protein YurZ